MPQKSLSTLFIKHLKPDPAKVIDYCDQEIDRHEKMRKGFMLRISPLGHKSWIARLKHKEGPKTGYVFEKKIGEYPQMGLADARTVFDEWKYHGIPEAKSTVNQLCDRFITEWSKPRKRTWAEDQRQLDNEVRDAIGDMPIDEVTRKDIKAILNKVNDRGAPCSANSLLAVIRKMFNWAIDVDLLETTPCNRLKLFPVEHHSSFLNESELKTFLQQLPTAEMPETMRQVFLFQLQTCSRVSETRGVRWDEIDLEHGVWTASLDEAHGDCGLANDLLQDIELFLRKRNFGGLAWHDFLRPWKTLVKTRAPPVRKTCLSSEYQSGRLRRMGRCSYYITAMA